MYVGKGLYAGRSGTFGRENCHLANYGGSLDGRKKIVSAGHLIVNSYGAFFYEVDVIADLALVHEDGARYYSDFLANLSNFKKFFLIQPPEQFEGGHAGSQTRSIPAERKPFSHQPSHRFGIQRT